MTKPTKTLLAVAALLPLCACSSTQSSIASSQEYAADRNYYLAYKVLERARDPEHNDPELEKAFWDARLEYLIDRADNAIFGDREPEALGYLHQALALSPGNPVIVARIDKAKTKLAQRAVDRGDERLAEADLAGALQAYTEAQRHVAGYPAAIAGTQKVRVTFERMHHKAQLHFLEALRLYPELRWAQVEWHTETALANNPDRKDVEDLQKRAQHRLAERSFRRGAVAEKERRYGAALMEYRAAKNEEAGYASVEDAITRMQNEVKAEMLTEKAQAHLVNKRFSDAQDCLAQALQLTVLEKTTVSDLMLQAKRLEAMERYQLAKDLELQNQKAEALAAFQELVKAWPDGLADEKVRVDNLQHDIDSAEKEWQAAEAAEQQGDAKAALQHYRSANDFYPGWKDLKARIDRLTQQIPK